MWNLPSVTSETLVTLSLDANTTAKYSLFVSTKPFLLCHLFFYCSSMSSFTRYSRLTDCIDDAKRLLSKKSDGRLGAYLFSWCNCWVRITLNGFIRKAWILVSDIICFSAQKQQSVGSSTQTISFANPEKQPIIKFRGKILRAQQSKRPASNKVYSRECLCYEPILI